MRFNMTPEDAEDCAGDFVLILLQAGEPSEVSPVVLRGDLPLADAERHLATCAHNFAFHRRRQITTRHQREPMLSSQEAPDGVTVGAGMNRVNENVSTPSAEATLLAHLEDRDFWYNLLHAVAALSLPQRHVFVRFYLEDETLTLIAERSGQSVPSLKQSLYRARHSVRTRLPNPSQKTVEKF